MSCQYIDYMYHFFSSLSSPFRINHPKVFELSDITPFLWLALFTPVSTQSLARLSFRVVGSSCGLQKLTPCHIGYDVTHVYGIDNCLVGWRCGRERKS